MTQLALPVRTTDTDTSYEAAMKAVAHSSKYRPIVLAIVEELGPLTHDELIAEFRHRTVMDPEMPRASDSGIRTRLRELVQLGLVERHPENGVSVFGNTAKRWVAIDESTYVPKFELPSDKEVVDGSIGEEDYVHLKDSSSDPDTSSDPATVGTADDI